MGERTRDLGRMTLLVAESAVVFVWHYMRFRPVVSSAFPSG